MSCSIATQLPFGWVGFIHHALSFALAGAITETVRALAGGVSSFRDTWSVAAQKTAPIAPNRTTPVSVAKIMRNEVLRDTRVIPSRRIFVYTAQKKQRTQALSNSPGARAPG
jgi:hypothetical protein